MKGVASRRGIGPTHHRSLTSDVHVRAGDATGRKSVRPKIVLTGGGTAGHVLPALAVGAELTRGGAAEIVFLGRAGSIEERLATEAGVPFRRIHAQGLRRYA